MRLFFILSLSLKVLLLEVESAKKWYIEDSFLYCIKTNNLIDNSIENEFFNELNFYRNFNQDFFQLKLISNEINFYSLNGNLFYANCSKINKILVPDWVSKCTRDILAYMDGNWSRQVFLNVKTKILSDITTPIPCIETKKTFYLDLNSRVT